MIFSVIIGLSALFALLWLFKIEEKFVRWITLAAALSTGVTLMPYAIPSHDGFVAYLIIQGVFLLYAFSPNDYTNRKRIHLSIVIFFPTIYMLLTLLRVNNPLLIVTGFLCLVSLLAYLQILVKEVKLFKDEIGFLTIIAVHAFLRLIFTVQDLVS
ncbi:MAG: hypothetical protein MI810_15590 [Flavobacteriales bacterium]|nr:hypothetical protein [Flavobacteriales bacterium]